MVKKKEIYKYDVDGNNITVDQTNSTFSSRPSSAWSNRLDNWLDNEEKKPKDISINFPFILMRSFEIQKTCFIKNWRKKNLN